jgi:hypothetical protein
LENESLSNPSIPPSTLLKQVEAFDTDQRIPEMENGNLSQGEGKDPSAFLSDIIGNSVTVKLNSGVVYKGIFSESSA